MKTMVERHSIIHMYRVCGYRDVYKRQICNTEEPMCIAGVFGGLYSGTTEQTVDVFLESAYFNQMCIRDRYSRGFS